MSPTVDQKRSALVFNIPIRDAMAKNIPIFEDWFLIWLQITLNWRLFKWTVLRL